MTEIDLNEVKTELLNLLKWVEKGESFSIMNRGKVVAVILPPPDINRSDRL